MAYDPSTGIVTAPVSIADVKKALGVGSGDVGTLCRSTMINMWAKFKPVPCRRSGFIDTTIQLSGSVWNTSVSEPWWRNTTHKSGSVYINSTYGIDAKRAYSLNSLFSGYSNWGYDRPNGGIEEPYRLLDFLQYNHKAPQPLGSLSAPSSMILTDTEPWSIDVAMMKNQDDDDPISTRDYITAKDVAEALFGTAYFGFALVDKDNNSAAIWVTGTRYYGVGTNGGRLTRGHSYYVMPFFSSVPLPQDESVSNLNPGPTQPPLGTVFLSVPNIDMPTLTIAGGSVVRDDARFSVRGVLQNGILDVDAYIDAQDLNVQGGTIKFDGGTYPEVIIYVCKAGTQVGIGNPDPNDVITSRTFSSIQVSSGSRVEIGGRTQRFTGINVDKCRMFVYAGNGSPFDTTKSARCSGDAMVSSEPVVPQ